MFDRHQPSVAVQHRVSERAESNGDGQQGQVQTNVAFRMLTNHRSCATNIAE
jgi:hypothetical protein